MNDTKPLPAQDVGSGALLAGFTPLERLAIYDLAGASPTPESVKAVSEYDWRRLRGIGDRFILKLLERGMLGERDVRLKLSDRQRQDQKKAARLAKLTVMIERANLKIARWESEAKALSS